MRQQGACLCVNGYSEGFLFNRGGHALYTGGAASRAFEELGVTYEHGIPKDTFVLQDGRISAFPADPLGLLRTDALDVRDKLALFRFFVTLGRAKPQALARTSVQEWLDLKIHRPQLHQVMTAFARTFSYTTALDLVSAQMFVEKFQRSLKHPIHYIDGGWQVLVDGLPERCLGASAGPCQLSCATRDNHHSKAGGTINSITNNTTISRGGTP